MATTDDLVLLDRAVSNYHKAELFPAELGEPSEHTPGSWFGWGIQTFRCGMFDASFSRERSDGDCGFWRLNAHNLRGRLELASSQRANRTVAATTPGSRLLASVCHLSSVICHVSLCTLIISPSPSGLRSLP